MKETDFQEFAKMPRLSREVIITEKIDGTNAQILITPSILEEHDGDDHLVDRENILCTIEHNGNHYTIRAGSRNKWVKPGKIDNYGFAGWVLDNKSEIIKLGEGRHFGEWWGNGVQRGYNMKEKVFSLFNVGRWSDDSVRPACCRVVPELWRGIFNTVAVDHALELLKLHGSSASPGFMNPEGIVVWHTQGNIGFKKTLDKNDAHKSE